MLYTVHMFLLVTVVNRAGRKQDVSESSRLVLVASDEEQAKAKALAWLAESSAPDRVEFMFGAGVRKAVRVRLAESPGRPAMWVYEEPTGVVVR